jgi:long-chain fatty acid transport protein
MRERGRDTNRCGSQRVVAVGITLVTFLAAGSARAGGLYLTTFGTPHMGTASAGAQAAADDPSTAFYNPAGMTRLDDHHALGGLAPGYATIEFKAEDDTPRGGGDGGQQGGFLPIMAGQYVHKLSDRWRLGFSLLSLSGAQLDPKNDWAGRNEVVDLSLLTLTMMPTVGVRLFDWLSIGGGAAITYGRLTYKFRLPLDLLGEPRIRLTKLDDWKAAPIASVLIEPTPTLRLGVTYMGKTDFVLEGKAKLNKKRAHSKLDLPLAQSVRASVFWDASDRLALMLSGGWEDWSVTETIPVSVGGQSGVVPLGFRDTWYLAGGVHYRVLDPLTLQLGLRYDSSALKDSDRTTAFPIDRVYTLGAGALYDWSETFRLGFSFVWTDLGKAPVDSKFTDGKYRKNDLFLFGVSLYFKKLPWSGMATI